MKQPVIKTKRVFEASNTDDGRRYLVDRLWPRGVQKEEPNLEAWLKDVAPSDALRRWFNHDPSRWDEFLRRYFAELDKKPESWRPILESAQKGPVTLLFAARDETHNNAVALKQYLNLNLKPGSRGAAKKGANPASRTRSGSALRPGKLPNDLLRQFLGELDLASSSLLIAPGVGEDIAAVPINREEVLVLKTDPITFATDSIGSYSVVVNVNDLATCGATPRWFLTSLLFPPGTGAELVHQVMRDLNDECKKYGMTLCGGHTEITGSVTRPVVVGLAAGTVSRKGLIDKKRMKKGDRILLTKGLAVEGTCVIAREFPGRLRKLGMSEREIRKCTQFLSAPGISILKEARVAADHGRITGMHDVTEGGLATALEELSAAGNHKILVYRDRIPVLKETRRLCQMLGLDPLGLIGSGSLLICCERGVSDEIMNSIRNAGIDVTWIGELLDEGEGVEAFSRSGDKVPWPHFEVDEITRLFADP